MLLTKFYAGGKFFFRQEFKIPFEILFTTFSQKKMSKYPENKLL